MQLLDYNKTKLEAGINSIKDSYSSHILSEVDYSKNLQVSVDVNKKNVIREMLLPELPVIKIFKSVGEIMGRKIVSNVITKLQENPRLNEWVRTGKYLHISEDTCQFCGNPLPATLMDKLEQHFTDDFDKLFRDIEFSENIIIQTTNLIDNFIIDCPGVTEFYPDYEKDYKDLMVKLKKFLEKIKNEIDDLRIPLDRKRKNPFQEADVNKSVAATSELSYDETDLKKIVQDINAIIQKHNQRSADFEKLKTEAKSTITQHQIAQFIVEIDYFNLWNELQKTNEEIENTKQKITEVIDKSKGLEAQLLDAKKGAQKVNEYLHTFFRHNRLNIDVQENGQFILKRNRKIAKNLSEGEKSAISFVYFITQLEERGTNLENTIVFIDDPISSLDQNHIHSISALIKAKLNPNFCQQIFISTHNSEFFNLMKDLSAEIPRFFGGRERDYEKYVSNYFIERYVSEDEIISRIVPLPQELRKFKSEYVFLFSLLKKFLENPIDDLNHRLIVPNVARRFLEAYLNFRKPSIQNLFNKMDLLFQNNADKYLVYKVTNEYSHNEQLNERTFRLPDTEECIQVVNLIFEALREKDKVHFEALMENVN